MGAIIGSLLPPWAPIGVPKAAHARDGNRFWGTAMGTLASHMPCSISSVTALPPSHSVMSQMSPWGTRWAPRCLGTFHADLQLSTLESLWRGHKKAWAFAEDYGPSV